MSTQSSQSDPNIDVTSPYTPRRPSPIISLSINHPIGTALRKIKNFLTHKQTLFSTSFTIKITPIVAIVSLAGVAALFGGGITTAFQYGKTVEQKFLATSPTAVPKVSPTPIANILVSKTGTVKATYQLPSSTPTPPLDSFASNGATLDATSYPTGAPRPVLHYILSERSGSIIFLSGSTINWQNYLNLRVLLTGSFDSSKNTLTVEKTSEIEVLQ